MGYYTLENEVWEYYANLVKECAEVLPLVPYPTEREAEFITDMAARLERYGRRWNCSDKQQDWLRSIHERWYADAKGGKLQTR